MRYLILCVLVAGCGWVPEGLKPESKAALPAQQSQKDAEAAPDVRPQARPSNEAVASVETAPATPAVPQRKGGSTIASLGSPAEPGLWMKTPLVQAQSMGKVSYNGKTVELTLIPIEGPATAGSRMSLQAFQALGAPLTELVEVSVAI